MKRFLGPLLALNEEDGILIATIGKINLMLPLSVHDPLQSLLGRRIAIIRTECDFLWRVLSVSSEKVNNK
jgi:hypothetical protein